VVEYIGSMFYTHNCMNVEEMTSSGGLIILIEAWLWWLLIYSSICLGLAVNDTKNQWPARDFYAKNLVLPGNPSWFCPANLIPIPV
jgi:hypothetical protein